MVLRYLLFGSIVIVFIIFIMALVKDTGDSRKKLEKRLKLNQEQPGALKAVPSANNMKSIPKKKSEQAQKGKKTSK